MFSEKRVFNRTSVYIWIYIVQLGVFFVLFFSCFCFSYASEKRSENDSQLFDAIFSDWQKQESHAGRTLASKESLVDLKTRGERLLENLSEEELISTESASALRLALSTVDIAKLEGISPMERLTLYIHLRWQIRKTALENSLFTKTPILFMKGNRFVCQMLHEYLSYYYQYTGMHGGGIYLLKNPGFSFETESLTDGKLPRGIFSRPSLSFDAKTIYFAFADFSKVQKADTPVQTTDDIRNRGYNPAYYTEYMKQESGKYHLFKMNLSDGKIEQLTKGTCDDFNPVPLPDGGLVFLSVRRGGFGRCHGGWEPLPVHTLYRREKNGDIKCLSWHETNEWQPSIMKDGRILYCRWDYVDRSASHHHGLWITNPDGTGTASLFGNYTYNINACYQPCEIPNSKKIMFVAGAHHLDVGGSLVMLDPSKINYNPKTLEDNLNSLESITPEIPFAETPNQCPDRYYFSPCPLSENYYLVSYSNDPLGGMLSPRYSGTTGKLGLYYRDRFGNLELLYEDKDYSCMYPQPVEEQELPSIIPSRLEPEAKSTETGTLFLSNVYESLSTLPKGRTIKELRVFQIYPKWPDHRSHTPPVGMAFAENARGLLGTVPVEKDGSAHFTVPANKPLYFQAVDSDGKAVQGMRSDVYLQSGESRGCVGCHEPFQKTLTNINQKSLASQKKPSILQPGPQGSLPFSFPLLVQPVLERACLSCHNGQEKGAKPSLTSEPKGNFTNAYLNLQPFIRWYEWGGKTIRETTTLPGQCGADISPLSSILDDKNHQGKMKLSDSDRRVLYLWLDANAPFYGRTDLEGQKEQREGKTVLPPTLQ